MAIGIILLLLVPFFGGMLIIGNKKLDFNLLKNILTYSGGFLFAVAILHMLPETYELGSKKSLMLLLLGFFIQLILEKFSEGTEHGHIHMNEPHGHDHNHEHHHKPSKIAGYMLLASLSIHSILEGMPLNGSFELTNNPFNNPLFLGIILHQAPTAIALVTVLTQNKLTKMEIYFALFIFAVTTPLGVLVGHFINDASSNDFIGLYILPLVTGMYLHISSTILFESTQHHTFNFKKIALSLLGALTVLFI